VHLLLDSKHILLILGPCPSLDQHSSKQSSLEPA